ncbi:MAG TPA: hypothetical protein VGI05_26700 [Streptosporangiaceae bacterium]|jgi:hypothetical protein
MSTSVTPAQRQTVFDTVQGQLRFGQASAYAWGHSDATGAMIPVGSFEFALAYAEAFAAFDRGAGRGHMHSIGGHYHHWLRTGGASIWED